MYPSINQSSPVVPERRARPAHRVEEHREGRKLVAHKAKRRELADAAIDQRILVREHRAATARRPARKPVVRAERSEHRVAHGRGDVDGTAPLGAHRALHRVGNLLRRRVAVAWRRVRSPCAQWRRALAASARPFAVALRVRVHAALHLRLGCCGRPATLPLQAGAHAAVVEPVLLQPSVQARVTAQRAPYHLDAPPHAWRRLGARERRLRVRAQREEGFACDDGRHPPRDMRAQRRVRRLAGVFGQCHGRRGLDDGRRVIAAPVAMLRRRLGREDAGEAPLDVGVASRPHEAECHPCRVLELPD
eukprot:1552983-Prymnesium_polylepis.2